MPQIAAGARPLIALAIGDPSGVGTEVAVKALQTGKAQSLADVMLIGNLDGIADTARSSAPGLRFVQVDGPAQARRLEGGAIPVYDDGAIRMGDYTIGESSAAGGRATAGWMQQAIDWSTSGEANGYLTAPVHNASLKLAGVSITERSHPEGTLTLRIAGKLRYVPIGEHVLMREVPAMVTKANVLRTILQIGRQLQVWGMANPRIAVAGLNPHCRGSEDEEEIVPAVAAAVTEGFDVKGPLSPDTVFRRAFRGEFDVVVAMYHDQGQIAIKTTMLEEACAVFVGFPYVRVGVPHGSAFDIAGKGIANPGTMLQALTTACRLASGAGL
jgi:4-phospho-D-threonate 3-dehydrogenase / 4-phospho-D-erythronate 3-dehydrogenase